MIPSAATRARYSPPIPEGAGASTCAWIALNDWYVTDAERRALLARVHELAFAMAPRAAKDAARSAGAAPSYPWEAIATLAGQCSTLREYAPCDDCHMIVLACTCGVCPECGDHTVKVCGCCPEDTSACSRCDECTDCENCACAHCEHPRCSGDAVESVCERCSYCPNHCECNYCDACGTACEYTCSNCGKGDADSRCGCCSCSYCETCSEPTSESVCGDCSSCESCGCECDWDDPPVRSRSGAAKDRDVDYTGHAPHVATARAARRTLNLVRLAGLEVEYVQSADFAPIHTWAKTWNASVTEDGSCGWECVTSPAAGDHLLKQVGDLADALAESGATIGSHNKCGVHVHVDARDVDWPSMMRLVRVWAVVESACFSLAGDWRRHTSQHGARANYCEAWGDTLADALRTSSDPKGALLAMLDTDRAALAAKGRRGECPGKHDGVRYRAMNVRPWLARWRLTDTRDYNVLRPNTAYQPTFKAGSKRLASDATIEFRLHEGCLDKAELQGWAALMACIVEYAVNATDRDVDALRDGRSALEIIAGGRPVVVEYLARRLPVPASLPLPFGPSCNIGGT